MRHARRGEDAEPNGDEGNAEEPVRTRQVEPVNVDAEHEHRQDGREGGDPEAQRGRRVGSQVLQETHDEDRKYGPQERREEVVTRQQGARENTHRDREPAYARGGRPVDRLARAHVAPRALRKRRTLRVDEEEDQQRAQEDEQ